jgi:hypothetical protein
MTDSFTNEEKHKAVLREIKYRHHVYDRLVATGSMSQHDANLQIAIFEAIAADYAKAAEAERLL